MNGFDVVFALFSLVLGLVVAEAPYAGVMNATRGRAPARPRTSASAGWRRCWRCSFSAQ